VTGRSQAGTCYEQPRLSAKFEVICTGYEDIKDDAKCRKWGVLSSQGSFKVTGSSTIQWSVYRFLLAFHPISVHILHRCWNIARCWSKIADS